MELVFWIICGGIVLALVVASITVMVGNRKAIRAAEELPSLAAGPAAAGLAEIEEPGPVELVEAGPEAAAGVSEELPVPTLEVPEAPANRMVRLRRRLAGSSNPLARGLLALLATKQLDAQTWEDFEDNLVGADLGIGPTSELVAALQRELTIAGSGDRSRAKSVLRTELVKLVDPDLDRSIDIAGAHGTPGVILVVGVNGTGKTTTVGKLARVFIAEGKKVVLGAADTFRAAAAEQLQTWGDRVGAWVVRGPEGSDPASVAYDAVATGIREGADVVIVDTAGRLHTKTGLMDELGKIKRVIEKKAPVSEVLLVIDATTGQNGLVQARVFSDVVDVTGIVLSKLDGSAKGGIVVQVQRELKVPVKFIGLGEGADDLAPFDAESFVDALLTED